MIHSLLAPFRLSYIVGLPTLAAANKGLDLARIFATMPPYICF